VNDDATQWTPERVEQLVRGDRICLDPAAVHAYKHGADAARWRQWATETVTVTTASRVGRFVVVNLADREPSRIADAGTTVLRRRRRQDGAARPAVPSFPAHAPPTTPSGSTVAGEPAAGGQARTVYVWLTEEEAEAAVLPERVDARQRHRDVQAAFARWRDAPPDAHYLVVADAVSGVIDGYA
jgi:hypothetical protein